MHVLSLFSRDGLLVPTANAAEAAVVEGLNVYPVGSLAEADGFLTGQVDMDPEAVDLDDLFAQHSHMDEDFVDVKGQDYAKRALLIAAAGCHNVLTLWTFSDTGPAPGSVRLQPHQSPRRRSHKKVKNKTTSAMHPPPMKTMCGSLLTGRL